MSVEATIQGKCLIGGLKYFKKLEYAWHVNEEGLLYESVSEAHSALGVTVLPRSGFVVQSGFHWWKYKEHLVTGEDFKNYCSTVSSRLTYWSTEVPVPFLSSCWSPSDQMRFLIFIFPVASGCESPAFHLKTLQAQKLLKAVIQWCIKSSCQVVDQECQSLVGWTPNWVWKCSVRLSKLYKKGQQLFVIIRHCPSASLWSSVESGTGQFLPFGRKPCAVEWAPNWVLRLIHPQICIARWYHGAQVSW